MPTSQWLPQLSQTRKCVFFLSVFMKYSGVPYFRFIRRSMVRRLLGTAQRSPSPMRSLTEKGCGDGEGWIGESTTRTPKLPKTKNMLQFWGFSKSLWAYLVGMDTCRAVMVEATQIVGEQLQIRWKIDSFREEKMWTESSYELAGSWKRFRKVFGVFGRKSRGFSIPSVRIDTSLANQPLEKDFIRSKHDFLMNSQLFYHWHLDKFERCFHEKDV